MKVFVVGANGQIGKYLVDLLKDSPEHSVRAMVRKEEQSKHLEKKGIESALVSLTGSVDEISNAAKGCDAIVFTAGSGGSTGADQTLLIDLDGAVKTIEAAENLGINRFIMVSAFQANNRENWNEAIKPYYVAKHYADRALLQSDLNYTIIKPGGLVNEPGTGKVAAAEELERGSIAREDVARTIFASLTEENTYKRSFDLISGDIAIAEALRKI
ncbi:SDR family oxidoreductase [Peribacillus sp. NPDC056705]|uniref:SDR family oxidoreductase n=1 Tax=Peribacillus sp. NPDC056705 TaxID=3345918 RepID=UPI00374A6756